MPRVAEDRLVTEYGTAGIEMLALGPTSITARDWAVERAREHRAAGRVAECALLVEYGDVAQHVAADGLHDQFAVALRARSTIEAECEVGD